jgi:hypothetical protein
MFAEFKIDFRCVAAKRRRVNTAAVAPRHIKILPAVGEGAANARAAAENSCAVNADVQVIRFDPIVGNGRVPPFVTEENTELSPLRAIKVSADLNAVHRGFPVGIVERTCIIFAATDIVAPRVRSKFIAHFCVFPVEFPQFGIQCLLPVRIFFALEHKTLLVE